MRNLREGTLAGLVLALVASGSAAQDVAVDTGAVDAARDAFVDRMVAEHGFDRAELAATLARAEINQDVLRAISRPAERVVPWYEYRNIFLTPARIDAGVQFWRDNATLVEATARERGVEPELLLAIVGIESLFGQRMGRYRVLDSLSTLAFAYPPRSRFFSGELEALLLVSREEGAQVLDALGSYAGAMGAGQFIPSSFRAYAVDADADGRRDLWDDWADILASVANYFQSHGWRAGEPVAVPATRAVNGSGLEPSDSLALDATVGSIASGGYAFTTELPADAPAMVFALEHDASSPEYWVGFHNFYVITRYNRSVKYALAAHELAMAIREGYEATRGGTVQ
jgi:membrane-bound lytic murein transglycosylase B